MKNILKSKMILVFAVCVALLLTLAGFLGKSIKDSGEKSYDPAKLAGADVRTVIPIKDYNQIDIYDAEEGIFLAEKCIYGDDDCRLDVIDSNGEVLKRYENMGSLYYFSEDNLFFEKENKDGTFSYIITEFTTDPDKKVREEVYSAAFENSLNGDLLLMKDNCYRFYDKDRNLIREMPVKDYNISTDRDEVNVGFTGTDEYARVRLNNGTWTVINYKTGETVYIAEKNQAVYRKICNKWVVYTDREDGMVDITFLNDDFTPAFDGQHCNDFVHNEKYIAFTPMDDKSLEKRIYDSDGNQYEFPMFGKDVRGFVGDIVLLSKGGAKVSYVNMTGPDKGKAVANIFETCYMDFDDGVALSLRPETSEGPFPDLTYESEPFAKCGYVDEDFKHLTKFNFDYAEMTQNGYAVVGIADSYSFRDRMGVIDFKKDRWAK